MVQHEDDQAVLIKNIIQRECNQDIEIKSSISRLYQEKPELKEILNIMSASYDDMNCKSTISLGKTKKNGQGKSQNNDLEQLHEALNAKNKFVLKLLDLVADLKETDVNNKKIQSDSQININEVKLENQMLKGNVKSLSNKISSLEKQLTSANDEKKMILANLTEFENEYFKVKAEADEQHSKLIKQQSVINDIEADNKSKDKMIAQLNDLIAENKKDIEYSNLKLYEKEEECLRTIDELRHEQLNIKEVKLLLATSEKKLQEKQEFMTKLQEKLAQIEENNKGLQNKVDEQYFELENSKVKLRKHIENEELLNEKLKDYEKKREKLVEEKEIISVENRE